MESLKIRANDACPAIYLDSLHEVFEIRGNSMPENASSFYKPVIKWLDEYIESPNPVTEIIFQMNLLNTSSAKLFIDIFNRINKIADSGKSDVNIIWYYNYGDEDIREVGADFKTFVKAPFELIPVKN